MPEDAQRPGLAEYGFPAEQVGTHEGCPVIRPVSNDTTQRDQTPQAGEPPADSDTNATANTQDAGNIPPASAVEPPASAEEAPCAREDGEAVRRRFIAEGRWRDISPVRDRMMVESKKAIPDKEARRAWVYAELDRMYPPVQQSEREITTYDYKQDTYPKLGTNTEAGQSDGGAIQGLSDLPEGWPPLPANASLAAEIGWVQANRLFMVEERPGKATRVRLDQAASPAPSRAALGWLETSIRSYAKFVDVAAKVSGGDDDGESAVMRRERKSVDDVKALLREMQIAEGSCTRCGRPF